MFTAQVLGNPRPDQLRDEEDPWPGVLHDLPGVAGQLRHLPPPAYWYTYKIN